MGLFSPTDPRMEPMRAAVAALAVLGYGTLAAAFGQSLHVGDGDEARWILIGPLPFCVVGLFAFLRRPENRVVWWLVGVGASFGASVALGDVFVPMAERHWGTDAAATELIALVCQWAGTGVVVAVIGVFGLFPSGRPVRRYEHTVMWVATTLAFLVPVLDAVSGNNIALTGWPGQNVTPFIRSGVTFSALAPLRGTFEALYDSYSFWTVVGIVLLTLRYWHGAAAERRQIRWLLIGVTASFGLWVPVYVFWWEADPQGAAASALATALSAVAMWTVVVAMLMALFYSGVFGIDEPGRRALVRRVLRLAIAIVIVIVAVTAGLLTTLVAPVSVAVVVGVAATAAGQAMRGWLEHAADRWVLGSRLAGYANLNRFGRALIEVPGSDGLLSDLAREVRRGLNLTWARVSLEVTDGPQRAATDGPAGEPTATVPIEYHGAVLGHIECGPRADGALLPEDRRLLAYFAAQAGIGVHNLGLAAELDQRIREVKHQAVELAESRDRVVAGQDAERRRIQHVLHDGVQQEIVALSARAGLARQQLLRGDPAAADTLADMQRDLATTLRDVREIAYAIHPPVLSDRGLLEAIEAQSSRLAVPMVVRADARLRGVRFGEQVEVAAWYVLAEALSNVVKHAAAKEVEVSLAEADHALLMVIRDDGCGFEPERPRGLGLIGLSDRLDTVGGSLTIDSAAGAGTSVCVRIPVRRELDPVSVLESERVDA